MTAHIHHTAFVGPGVELEDGVRLGPYAVVLGPAHLGDDTSIGPGAVIGGAPEITTAVQNAAWEGVLAHKGVSIGRGTIVREQVTVHQGSRRRTTIGADCWLLNKSYVAHDCAIGNGVTLSAGTALGGFVVVGDHANLGLGTTVHQYRRLGAYVMVGMGSVVTRDLPPFAKSFGSPAVVHGVNTVGMARAGFATTDVGELRELYAHGTLRVTDVPPAFRPAIEAWLAGAPERPAIKFES